MDRHQDEPGNVPLCVDLDGTLLRSDLLHESVLALLRINPLYLFLLPLWLLKGKAVLKREIASRVSVDPALLPYDPEVLALLHAAAGINCMPTLRRDGFIHFLMRLVA
jgi:hypothetical protein